MGGESPIGNSLELYERIQAEMPEFVEQLQERGLHMKQIYPAPYENDGKVSDDPDIFVRTCTLTVFPESPITLTTRVSMGLEGLLSPETTTRQRAGR